MPLRANGLTWSPPRLVVLTFAGAILLGTALLLIPEATAPGQRTDLLTALFTATSAVCVTGLTPVVLPEHWSAFGLVVILVLMQVGGLGIMTLSTLIYFILGRHITLRERIVIQEALGQSELAGVVRLVRRILLMTLAFEALGALALWLRWAQDMPAGKALWFGVFHAVSAFNNVGFDLFGTSLTAYVGDPVVNATVMGLIVAGGLGFVVIQDVWQAVGGRGRPPPHTRMVLAITAGMIALGTAAILASEGGNPDTLGRLPWPTKALAALFQAVAPRTAGFATVDTGLMRPLTLLLVMILMFVGASPGGTGGGIKTTTFGVLMATVRATVAGHEDVEVMGRRLHWSVVNRAFAIALIAFAIVLASTALLLMLQPEPFLYLAFEATSAFGTVGLSAHPGGGALTPHLSPLSQLVIIATMFTGRVGPLTLAYAIARRQRKRRLVRMPEARVMVG
ncbi:MAG: Trk family potassium uptake protein [Clostridia bacterium]|nr:Trk family potassium uptake protein [Clostridia bacterium]